MPLRQIISSKLSGRVIVINECNFALHFGVQTDLIEEETIKVVH